MRQILITCREAIVAAIPLIPIFWMLYRYKLHNKERSILYLDLAIYLAAMYATVGLPDITYYRYSPRFNFKPFLYMFSAWDTTLLNVLLFLPLGWFLPVLWKSFKSPLKTTLFGFCTSCVIEFLQIFTYRATDVNDLITNTFGTLLGYLLGITTLKQRPEIKPMVGNQDLYMILGISSGVMFLIYPYITMLIQ